jgi:hypothetical protein
MICVPQVVRTRREAEEVQLLTVSCDTVERVEYNGSDHRPDAEPAGRAFTTRYFEHATGAPYATLVEEDGVTRPHFHRADQFQIVVGGSGHFGKHPVEPVTIHYTDAYTPYGPIRPGKAGISFFTLRARQDPGFFPMPESRLEKGRPTGRGVTVAGLPAAQGTREGGEAGRVVDAIPEHADGLSAYSVSIQPGAVYQAPDPSRGGGQYLIVVAGSVTAGEKSLPARSVGFVDTEDPPFRVRAGDEGAQVVLAQFPSESSRLTRWRP